VGLAKTWAEWMTAGRGFIAVALVIFSKWHPLRAIIGACCLGARLPCSSRCRPGGFRFRRLFWTCCPTF